MTRKILPPILVNYILFYFDNNNGFDFPEYQQDQGGYFKLNQKVNLGFTAEIQKLCSLFPEILYSLYKFREIFQHQEIREWLSSSRISQELYLLVHFLSLFIWLLFPFQTEGHGFNHSQVWNNYLLTCW